MARRSSSRLQRGVGALEALIATMIMAVVAAGAVSGVMAGIAATHRAEGLTISGELARQAIEITRGQGFDGAPEGSVTRVFDANGDPLSISANLESYMVTTTVTSDRFDVSEGVLGPSQDALRTVIVTVRNRRGTVIDSIGTTLVRGGL